ncbi:MAG: YlmC/YmxH family sporulation protein [Clostridia bacterium]|nr:YlmC/YmxH family sporulation protein [Oscillospiraceae bacterium]MBQ4047571.1 YlmC/YmxH family sporulation protein [Clostridia bacterium]MBR7137357.1 YlmC/YmxH family sporulation protein [Clostridia bacterium]
MSEAFRLSKLQTKDVINIRDGKNYGRIFDVDFDASGGQILRIIVPGAPRFFGLLGREDDLEIPWEQICLIGIDTILVDLPELPSADVALIAAHRRGQS